MRSGRFRLVLVVATAALVASGCASGDGAGGEGGEVEIAAVWSGPEQESFQKVLDAFTEKTGTDVTFTSAGNDIATVLRTRIEGGSPPALAILPQPGLMRELAQQGSLKPIADVVGPAIDRDWAPDWKVLGSVDGTLYGLFYKAANKSTVWYNVGAFEDAGVEPPKTWDEMLATAKTLKAAGVTPFSIGGGDAWTLTDWFENIYLRTAGAENYDKLTVHELPWTDESVKKALTTFGQILSEKSWIAGDPTAVEFVPSVDAVFKDPPDAAIVYEGDFVPGVATVEATAGEDYDVFDFPSVGGSEPAVVGGGDIVVMLEDTPQARSLLEFLATAEAGEIWAKLGGFSSPNKAVDASSYPNDIARQTATALANAEVFRFDMSDLAPADFGGTPGRGQWALLQEFVEEPSDVDGIAAKLEAEAEKAYG